MAKWGEGDPRWIVEERSDGKNVNNWHWTEKNATEYSKNMLKQLLVDIEFADADVGSVKTTELTSITGEASASNRKGKLIFFYEFDVKVKWTGKAADDTTVSGSISLPNLSEENDISEVDVAVSMTSESSPARNKMLAVVRKQAPSLVRQKLSVWLRGFKEEYSKDIVLPTNVKVPQHERSVPGAPSPVTSPAAPSATAVASASASSSRTSGSQQTAVTSIQYSDEFHCSPQDLFEAIVKEERVSVFTQSAAKIDARAGGQFVLFGGNVTGIIKNLVPYERIEKAWRFSSWTEGHYSDVVITITPQGSETTLSLTQTNVPVQDAERTHSGWKDHYFQRMKMILGFGSGISLGF